MGVLEFMGLTAYSGHYAFGLPYGVLKKIEIARTLMCSPRLIILDEPPRASTTPRRWSLPAHPPHTG